MNFLADTKYQIYWHEIFHTKGKESCSLGVIGSTMYCRRTRLPEKYLIKNKCLIHPILNKFIIN